jgi:hypothetical protein
VQIEAQQCEVIVMSDVVYEPVGYTPLLHTLDRIARYSGESLLKLHACITEYLSYYLLLVVHIVY